MTNILRYWPDVTPGEFTALREVAQEIQRQKDAGEAPGQYRGDSGAFDLVAPTLCSQDTRRADLIACAAMIVRVLCERGTKG